MTKQPQKDSKRSLRRKSRGFVDLSTSSRMHRRANRRLSIACTMNGQLHKPGEKAQVGEWLHTAGGSINYH